MSVAEVTASIRLAAAVYGTSRPVIGRWLFLGIDPEAALDTEHLQEVRDLIDPKRHRRGPQVAHGPDPLAGRLQPCDRCREAQTDAARHASGARRKSHSRPEAPQCPST